MTNLVILLVLAAALSPLLLREFRYWRAVGLLRARYAPSVGVRHMLALRMDAAHGTPTVWEKLAALFGGGGANRQAILDGEARDLSQAEQDLMSVLQPLLHSVESVGIVALQTFISDTLKAAPAFGSVADAVNFIKSELGKEAGDVATQAEALGETSLTTLVSAILATLGHVALPVV